MRFGEYLISEGVVDQEQILDALDLQLQKMTLLGRLSLDLGYLRVKQVMEILGLQADRITGEAVVRREMLFGEMAVELGYLDPNALIELLAQQKKTRPPIGEMLVEMGAMTQVELKTELRAYAKVSV